MFLKNLDILGFKSFADKTHIEFAGGITALVGPNGCGKSNVVDAIKWVIGEQSARAMRADSMEDVIFNGTETRKPLNLAEVTLTIANDAGLLPIDMPEVQIRRRLYRSGESEYFINNQAARLKEVRELFWDTGVGKAAYSVMEQGKIDQALSAKPEERRYIFDEAAGINRNKAKNREAELKIARFEENIKQVNIILAETKKSYDALKIQAEKTLRYRVLKDEIFGLERDIQLLRLKQFRDNRDARNQSLKLKTEERDRERAELDAYNAALTENTDLVNALEKQMVESQKILFGLAQEKKGLENETNLLGEQRAESNKLMAQNEARKAAIAAKIEQLEDDADEQDEAARDMREKAESVERNIGRFDENIALAAGSVEEHKAEIARRETEIGEFGARQAAFEAELETITDDIVAALDAGLKDAGYSAQERRSTQKRLEEALLRLETLLKGRAVLARDVAEAAARAEGGAGSAADLKAHALRLEAAFAEALEQTQAAGGLFADYVAKSPLFIDEFLAPEGIVTRKRDLDARVSGAKEEALARRERIAHLRKENEALGAKIDEYKQTLHDLRLQKAQIDAASRAAGERAALFRRELAGQSAQLKATEDDLFAGRKRRDELDERLADNAESLADIERRGGELANDMAKLEKELEKKTSEVSGRRQEITRRTERIARIGAELERLHIEQTQFETEIKNIQENFRETHSRDLMEFEERIYQIDAPLAGLREALNAARNGLRDLGSPNLMAPEEFNETKAHYELLSAQVADLLKAREDEEKVAAEIRAKSSELFLETYNKIKKNFHNMFRRLFGGGRAELRLSDPDHVLESGIEIFAQPPGKKQENISLLSGGEKSMTAVALLFATYMVRPSPFCLLDEIDAALDEANVLRFVTMLGEFGRASQFIVITHNIKTAAGVSTILGVTQEEQGVTKMASIRLVNKEEAETALREEAAALPPFEEEDVPPEEGRELPL